MVFEILSKDMPTYSFVNFDTFKRDLVTGSLRRLWSSVVARILDLVKLTTPCTVKRLDSEIWDT